MFWSGTTSTWRPAKLFSVGGSTAFCRAAHAHSAPTASTTRLLPSRMVGFLPDVGAVVDARHRKARLSGVHSQLLLLALKLGHSQFLDILPLVAKQCFHARHQRTDAPVK